MKSLRFFEEAAEESEQERQWYRERSVAAEASFQRELDHAVESILESPIRWPKHIAGTRRYVLSTFPFSFIYFVEGETVFVVALAHQSRRPGYWRERLR